MDNNLNIVDNINSFRKNPSSFEKSAEQFYKMLKRSKKEQQANRLEKFIVKMKSKSSLDNILVSQNISKIAQESLESIIKNKEILIVNDNNKFLKEKLNREGYHSQEYLEISDLGDIENLIFRIATNELITDKLVEEVFLSNKFKHLGIASSMYNNQILTNLIFLTDIKEISKVNQEDLELKEAFDLFDIYKTGKLDQVALKEAFIGLGFDKSSHSVYNAILKLNTNNKVIKQGGVDWDTFVTVIKALTGDFESKEGLKKIFDLFIDDPNQNKISAETLKRVSNEVEDDIAYNEIVKILKRSSENGCEIDFDEFCRIMKDYNEISNSNII
jgi:Ca2+-binding EF-hand superfamily protein